MDQCEFLMDFSLLGSGLGLEVQRLLLSCQVYVWSLI